MRNNLPEIRPENQNGILKDPLLLQRAITSPIDNDSPLIQELFSATELLERNIVSIPCLLDPILPRVGLVSIAGSSDTGKSSLLRQLAIAVCLGNKSFLDFHLKPLYRRVLYVSTEDDDTAISFLLNKTEKESNHLPKAYNGLKFLFYSDNLLLRLNNIIGEEPYDMIIVDAFADLYGRSMNETNQVRTFLNEYSQLATKHQCLIVFLHHTGKRTESLAPSKHNLLGSQGFEAKMRLVIELRKDIHKEDLRHLCIVKGNYLPAEYKSSSYVLRFDNNMHFSFTGERKRFDELNSTSKEFQNERIVELNNEGKTQKEIAEALGISQPTVSRALSKDNIMHSFTPID